MRKYDSKNKRNIGIIIGVCIIFTVIFSYFLFQRIKISKINYELESGTILFDIDKNNILLNDVGIIKKKWNSKYYLKYKDEQYNIGPHVIAFNNNKTTLSLYGEFYEIFSNSKVENTKEETKLMNLTISRFYKIADRKYLIVDSSINTEDQSLKTSNYLVIELDKQGNAILYNNNLNVKVFSATKIVTSSYTFDIANELLIYEDATVDLKKILGTTNEYKEKEPNNSNGGGDGTGNGDGASGNGGNGTGGNGNSGTGTGGNTGNGGTGNSGTGNNNGNPPGNLPDEDDDIITNEPGTDINKGEIINQTAYTSILRLVPNIDSINVEYIIYDKVNEYINTFVEVEGPSGVSITYLPKSNTSVTLNNLKFGTTYKLTFKYTHFIGTDAKEEIIDTYNVTTLTPNVSLLGTKVTNKKIDYKIESQYNIESAKLRLYVNGEKQNAEISINSDTLTGSFSIAGVVIPINGLVELKLEEIYIGGAKVNRNVSYSYRATNTQLPEIIEPPKEEPTDPENPEVPENPENPETPNDEGTE